MRPDNTGWGIFGASCLIGLGIFILLNIHDAPTINKLSTIDTLKTQIQSLKQENDSLKLQSDLIWKFVFAIDSISQRDHQWLNNFKREYPWIDKQMEEDRRMAE
jgi:hypothetical protein